MARPTRSTTWRASCTLCICCTSSVPGRWRADAGANSRPRPIPIARSGTRSTRVSRLWRTCRRRPTSMRGRRVAGGRRSCGSARSRGCATGWRPRCACRSAPTSTSAACAPSRSRRTRTRGTL
ncbi:hypothetical protein T492DRAFT_964517 [Pavlovales sp. CCMP2436]|nr:hypothetical protein T492DRAFT_964517 [Pavlovales sp. CCMP2436]